MEIKYIIGDVREPIGDGRKIICHCCNDLGVMGSGVALALLKKWPDVRSEYIKWAKNGKITFKGKDIPFELGKVQYIRAEKDIAVANMIAQHDVVAKDGLPPIRYSELEQCLVNVADVCIEYGASAHIPYLMGCDRAGGKWEVVENALRDHLLLRGIELTIYDIFNQRGENEK